MTSDEIKKMHSLCRLRSTLESFALHQWRDKNKTNNLPEKIPYYLEQLRLAANQTDFDKFHKIDTEFHRSLILSVRLEPLEKNWSTVVEALSGWIFHVQKMYWPSLMSLYREHVLLVKAWQSDDLWIAEEATHQHLEAGWYRRAAVEENFQDEMDPVDRATSYMSTHFASQLDIEWIAKNVSFISTSHLTRLFCKKVGQSPYSFLKQTRLERAAMLVQSTPEKILQVAHRVGYKNVSHFVRDFRAKYGMTPLQYRKKHQ